MHASLQLLHTITIFHMFRYNNTFILCVIHTIHSWEVILIESIYLYLPKFFFLFIIVTSKIWKIKIISLRMWFKSKISFHKEFTITKIFPWKRSLKTTKTIPISSSAIYRRLQTKNCRRTITQPCLAIVFRLDNRIRGIFRINNWRTMVQGRNSFLQQLVPFGSQLVTMMVSTTHTGELVLEKGQSCVEYR